MTVPIIQSVIPKNNPNRPGYSMVPEWITVHDTGNDSAGADADNHADWLNGLGEGWPSWHFTVDDKKIVQHLPLNENGWHAGDGGSGPGNRKSIGVEICMNKDGDRSKAEANAAWLIAKLTREVRSLKPFPECVKQHNFWNGKNCPRILRGRQSGWENFISSISKELTPNANRVHIVAQGDTLWEIGQKYGVSHLVIQEYNNIKDPTTLQVGQKVVIPAISSETNELQQLKSENEKLKEQLTAAQNKNAAMLMDLKNMATSATAITNMLQKYQS